MQHGTRTLCAMHLHKHTHSINLRTQRRFSSSFHFSSFLRYFVNIDKVLKRHTHTGIFARNICKLNIFILCVQASIELYVYKLCYSIATTHRITDPFDKCEFSV